MRRLRHKPVIGDRRLNYQKRQVAAGLCRQCGAPKFLKTVFCQKHYIIARTTANRVFTGWGSKAWVARREMLLGFANGVFFGAMHKSSTPFRDWEQVSRVIVKAFFSNIPPQHGGRRLESFSRWIFRWDRRLRK